MNNSIKLVVFIGSLSLMGACCLFALIAYSAQAVAFGDLCLQIGVAISFIFIITTAMFASSEWNRK